MLTKPMTLPRLLIAAALLITAVSVFVFSGSEQAPAVREIPREEPRSQYTLRIEPQQVKPGGQIQVYVINGGNEPVGYGATHMIERLGGNGWQEATIDFYGLDPGFPANAMWAQPGDSDAAETIPVPEGTASGVYRVVKNVYIGSPDGGPSLPDSQVYGEFVVE